MFKLFGKNKDKPVLNDKVRADKLAEQKSAIDQAVNENHEAKAKFKNLIKDNHFTVIIAATMGAEVVRRRSHHGH